MSGAIPSLSTGRGHPSERDAMTLATARRVDGVEAVFSHRYANLLHLDLLLVFEPDALLLELHAFICYFLGPGVQVPPQLEILFGELVAQLVTNSIVAHGLLNYFLERYQLLGHLRLVVAQLRELLDVLRLDAQPVCDNLASRGAAAPSRHRCDSCSSDEVVGGFFVEFEAIRTESRDRVASSPEMRSNSKMRPLTAS